ncbi:peptidylprolyl isomerase [Lusitaniella coriacea LEGE 07157]|uniref:peptidylprolyl isomerase n=1 Tax=Lusitaniella coriacea LEGE 07157 TaxID=945747 RepID=A0A8J7JAR2_9CYAN|nr:peptidylprolyl isomerase [Lusitaniella coriacea]MBE9116500.1 peptidylprolyl isomerase [Lusitaniella coriacea LEGE 07157]
MTAHTLSQVQGQVCIADRVFNAEEVVALMEKHQLMPHLTREVIIDRAIEAISVTPKEIAFAYSNFFAQRRLSPPELQQFWLQQQGLSQAQLQQKLMRDLKIHKFKQENWGSQLPGYFLQRKTDLDRVVYSLVRTNSLMIAQELYFRIQAGEASFAEISRQYSIGSESQTNGIVGPVELSRLDPTLAGILAKSYVGKLLPPVQLGEWIVIIRLEEQMLAQLDSAMEQRLLDELFEQWVGESVNSHQ